MAGLRVVYKTKIEAELGFEFVSDPRLAMPLPPIPVGHPADLPFHLRADEFEITPEIARNMVKYRIIRPEVTPKALQHADFTSNRQIIFKSVKEWREKARKNQINPRVAHGLAFTPDGFVLDGQHRLLGAAWAGVSMRLPIALNTAWDTFRVTDSGTARTAAQMLGSEFPYPKASAAAVKMISAVLEGNERTTHMVSSLSRENQLDMIQAWPFFRDKETFNLMYQAHRGSSIPMSHLVSVCAMAHGALTQLGRKYKGSGTAKAGGVFEIDAFLRGLTGELKNHEYEDWGSGNDPRFLLMRQMPRIATNTKAAEPQRESISLLRRGMSLWLDRYEKREPLARIQNSRNGLLWPVWRSDMVMAYAADRRLEINEMKKG